MPKVPGAGQGAYVPGYGPSAQKYMAGRTAATTGADGSTPRGTRAAAIRAGVTEKSPRPALFLDRDGVLNEDPGYVYRWEDFRWIPGARETVAAFNAKGWWVFVIHAYPNVVSGKNRNPSKGNIRPWYARCR